MLTPTIRTAQLGPWELHFSDEEMVIPKERILQMTHFLNKKWLPFVQRDYARYEPPNLFLKEWGAPSLLIRMDMPCLDEGMPFGIYEVEANPAGYGADALVGVPIGKVVADALKSLGITSMGYGVASSRKDQEVDLQVFEGLLTKEGIEMIPVEVNSIGKIPKELPLWLRAGQEDISVVSKFLEQCLLLHQDGGGHKGYLAALCDAKVLMGCDPWEAFPEGFALKPLTGWGSHDVELWCPDQPWKGRSSTVTRINRIIEELRISEKADQFIVQPFLKPRVIEGGFFRIWRIYAVWTHSGYEVMGGIWSQRPHIKVHGASDTVDGAVTLPPSL